MSDAAVSPVGRISDGMKAMGINAAQLEAALAEPSKGDAPAPIRKVYMGVLYKWVNIGKGWRPRFFVLDMHAGVMKYFKVHGESKVNVEEECRMWNEANATVELLGEEVQRLRRKAQRQAEEKLAWKYNQPAAQGEASLQVSSLRESGSDHKKFYIDTGTKTLQLRAETRDDRWAWLQALDTSKQQIDLSGRGNLMKFSKEDLTSSTADSGEVSAHLYSKGVAPELVDYVVEKMHLQHIKYMEAVVAEREKRRTLLDYVRTLEEEKRELEDQAVVESVRGANTRVLLGANLTGSPQTPGSSMEGIFKHHGLPDGPILEEAEDNGDGGNRDHTKKKATEEDSVADEEYSSSGEGGGSEDEDEEEDAFFDCDDEMYPPQYSVGESMRSYKRQGSIRHLLEAEEGGGGGTAASPLLTRQQSQDLARALASTPTPAGGEGPSLPAGMEQEAVPVRREKLPSPVEKEKSVSLWSIIKEAVGKDLTRICLPVYFNEPLSALQKACEDMEYSELLDAAAMCPPGSEERLLYVSAFAVSSYSSTEGRTQKPFNPLLGESYEAIYPEKGYRFVSEKVSHHPTIVAAHAEGRGWTFGGETDLRTKFWGRYIEINPVGLLRVTFHDGGEGGEGERYTWTKVSTSINNLIIGKLYVDHYGTMKVKNMNTGDACKMKFKEQGFMDKNPHQVKGGIEKKGGGKGRQIWGKWDDALYAESDDGKGTVCLWSRNPPAEDPVAQRYNLSSFAITLNELTEGLESKLPRTDARLRPDQRLLEEGRFTEAFQEKQRLEHKQRAARKLQESGDTPDPSWFVKAPPIAGSGHAEEVYEFKGSYWACRQKGDWEGVRDIFGR